MRDDFSEYFKDLALYRNVDSRKFYRIMNSLLKCKSRQKMVKGINIEDEIFYDPQKRKVAKKFFKELYKGEHKSNKDKNS
jgi:hypothetical protein